MADTLLHRFHSAKADFADTNLVRPSNWNDTHAFSGGTDGQLVARKAAADSGFEWVDPVTFDYIDVKTYATGGTGTRLDPWTGWESAFSSTIFKSFYFRTGYFQTSTALTLTESHPDAAGLCGYFSLKGAGVRKSVILWTPTNGVASGSVPEFSANDLKTWLTIGAVGKQAIGVEVGWLTVASEDTVYQKRAFHFIDFRHCRLQFISMNLPGTFWRDPSHNSMGLHIEGRGQNLLDHLYLDGVDRPMTIGGSPNDGIYHEWDTNIITNISLAVVRGGASRGPEWVARPNLYIQKQCSSTRNLYQRIDMNGGSYGVQYPCEVATIINAGDHWDSISWEDPCPLDASIIAASRIAADVPPSAMTGLYGDNAALEPASAWGYMFSFNASVADQGYTNLLITNVNQATANGLSLHKIFGVTLVNYATYQLGHDGTTYPGQLVQDNANPLLEANKPVILDLTGTRVGGPVYPSFPVVAINCQAYGAGRINISDDLDCIDQLYPDPIQYTGTNLRNISPYNLFKSPYTVWDAVRDVVTGYAFAGIYEFTPRLLSTGGSGEPTYFIQKGVMAVQNVSGMQMITFNLELSIDTIPGTMSGDVYIEPAAPIWGNRGGFTGATTPGGAVGLFPVTVGPYSGITLTAGYTQLTARMAASSARIFLEEVGTSPAGHNVIPISSVANGTLLTLSGCFMVGI